MLNIGRGRRRDHPQTSVLRKKRAVLQADGTIPVVTNLLNNMVRIGANSTESSFKRVVYEDISSPFLVCDFRLELVT
jgi:hypothetical protein